MAIGRYDPVRDGYWSGGHFTPAEAFEGKRRESEKPKTDGPWRLVRDWTDEIFDSEGRLVAKCQAMTGDAVINAVNALIAQRDALERERDEWKRRAEERRDPHP